MNDTNDIPPYDFQQENERLRAQLADCVTDLDACSSNTFDVLKRLNIAIKALEKIANKELFEIKEDSIVELTPTYFAKETLSKIKGEQ